MDEKIPYSLQLLKGQAVGPQPDPPVLKEAAKPSTLNPVQAGKNTAPVDPPAQIEQLKGTAKKLARLVEEHATFEFEGFHWLPATIGGIAEKLHVADKTIWRIIQKPPFHYITRNTEEDGRHILLKLGADLCETDHVFRLRAIWVKGLIYFNAVMIDVWGVKLIELLHQEKGQTFPKGKKKPSDRLRARIAAAEKDMPKLDKIKAGKKLSLEVADHEMGLLRGVVQVLGNDAEDTVACLVTPEGWQTFCSYLKADDRLEWHYHWPSLGPIVSNPDIALQTLLDKLQFTGEIELVESARLLTRIEELAAAKGH